MREPRVRAIRASPSSPVDRNLKKPLGQGRNPGSCLIFRGSPGHDRVEHKLAAVPAADVAGYSRLSGQGEEGTHARLQSLLRSLVDRKIAEHRGRVAKNTGDRPLAEFSSVVDAVRCAVHVQPGMSERNADVPEERRIEFRIDVNVGDVMPDRSDIFGDAVNVATRLEGLDRLNIKFENASAGNDGEIKKTAR
jgi:class 3 adenylate cyclase